MTVITSLRTLELRKWSTRTHLLLGLFNYAYFLFPAPNSFVYLNLHLISEPQRWLKVDWVLTLPHPKACPEGPPFSALTMFQWWNLQGCCIWDTVQWTTFIGAIHGVQCDIECPGVYNMTSLGIITVHNFSWNCFIVASNQLDNGKSWKKQNISNLQYSKISILKNSFFLENYPNEFFFQLFIISSLL
jgi:hypothetical protein